MDVITAYLLIMLENPPYLHAQICKVVHLHAIQWFIYMCLPYEHSLCYYIHNGLIGYCYYMHNGFTLYLCVCRYRCMHWLLYATPFITLRLCDMIVDLFCFSWPWIWSIDLHLATGARYYNGKVPVKGTDKLIWKHYLLFQKWVVTLVLTSILLNGNAYYILKFYLSPGMFHWSFIRKDLCKARAKPHSVFKKSDEPLLEIRLWFRLTFGQTAGQVDLWSDVAPWVRLQVMLTFGQTSGQVDLWSDVPPMD